MPFKSAEAASHSTKSETTPKSRRFSFRKPGKGFNKLLKFTLGNFLRYRYNVCLENEVPKNLPPPYLILANHTNTWDPFILSYFVEEPICFVTSDFHFRKPLLRILLGLVGAIPKSKGVSDIETIKSIIKAQKSGCVIGIFPEGQRSWDGHTLDLIPATAKLIKSMRVPVVTCLMKGSCLSLPRWSKKIRKGSIQLDFKLSLSTDDISGATVDEILGKIQEDLYWDEYDYQEKSLIAYSGREAARYLELYLFICPECGSIGRLRSEGSRLICLECGNEVKYNEFGYFESKKGVTLYKTPAEWNKWQLKELDRIMVAAGEEAVFADSGVVIKRGSKYAPLTKYGYGTISMYKDRIEFKGVSVKNIFFLEKIHGANVQFNDVFEFYYENVLYTFLFRKKRMSAYKWVEAVKAGMKFLRKK